MPSPQDETLTQVFLTHLVGVLLQQNYPKYISSVVWKILEEKKNTIIRCFVRSRDLPEIGSPVAKVENLYFQFSLSFTAPILADFWYAVK